MNDDAASANRKWIGEVNIVRRADPVVVHDNSILSDLDPELVDAATAVDVAIVCGENELVPWNTINLASAAVLCFEPFEKLCFVDQ